MPDYVYDNVSIATKLERRPLPAGEDPLKWDRHTDYNAHTDAVVSLRSSILTGKWHGFTPQDAAGITALSQASTYRLAVRDSDKHLVFWNGTTLTDLSAGGGGGGAAPLTLVVDDASSSAVTNIITLRHTTSGTAAAGIGASLLLESEDSAGGTIPVSEISAVLSDVTDGDSTGYLRFRVMTGDVLADAFYAHGGGISIGVPSISALYPLHVSTDGVIFGSAALLETTDTANSTVLNALTIHRKTSHGSNGAAGIGVGILFESEDASGNVHQAVADIAGVLSVATHASEKGYLRLRAMSGSGALADGAYVWGTGRVGIGTGTSEPSAALHVVTTGAGASDYAVIIDKDEAATTANNLQLWKLNGTEYARWRADNTGAIDRIQLLVPSGDIIQFGTNDGTVYCTMQNGVSSVGVSFANGSVDFGGYDIKSCQGISNGGSQMVSLGSNTLAFYAGTPATKQTVTGSRGGNAALASLLTALATIGLFTDSTSA